MRVLQAGGIENIFIYIIYIYIRALSVTLDLQKNVRLWFV